jgi:hypothetical protein
VIVAAEVKEWVVWVFSHAQCLVHPSPARHLLFQDLTSTNGGV